MTRGGCEWRHAPEACAEDFGDLRKVSWVPALEEDGWLSGPIEAKRICALRAPRVGRVEFLRPKVPHVVVVVVVGGADEKVSIESLKQNFTAYRSSKVSDCILEIDQLWQSGFRKVYSNYCCSCSFEPEIIKIGQSSHKIYSNNIVNFQESTTILNVRTEKVWKLMHYMVVTISLNGFVADCYILTLGRAVK